MCVQQALRVDTKLYTTSRTHCAINLSYIVPNHPIKPRQSLVCQFDY